MSKTPRLAAQLNMYISPSCVPASKLDPVIYLAVHASTGRSFSHPKFFFNQFFFSSCLPVSLILLSPCRYPFLVRKRKISHPPCNTTCTKRANQSAGNFCLVIEIEQSPAAPKIESSRFFGKDDAADFDIPLSMRPPSILNGSLPPCRACRLQPLLLEKSRK